MILTRGARATGAVLCALLAAIVAGWLLRDLGAADDPGQVLRYWAGYYDARLSTAPATSADDVALLVMYVVVALAALRSAAASGALVVTGVVTFAVRLPGLWTIGSPGAHGRFSDGLSTLAMVSAFAALAAGIALLITVGAGRRPAAGFGERVPDRPGQGASVTAFLLLGASAAIVAAWEIRQTVKLPELLPGWFVGGERFWQALTDAPPGWRNALLVLLCLFTAVSALARAPHTRPFGLVAAGLLLLNGVLAVVTAAHYNMLEHFGELPTEDQLRVLSWLFEAFAAVVVLLVLARRGPADAPVPPYQGYDPAYGQGYQGHDPAYGQGPGRTPGHGQDQGAGQGPGDGPGGAPGPGRPQGPGYGAPGPGNGPYGTPPPPSYQPPPSYRPPYQPPPPPNQPPPPPSQPPGW
ncbi:hypothetical protein [Streptomyces sp. PTD5-9]|uniref:hypothetical protein n=1 Tax=Streptomyces sp. PTD5-9 TaxID=3120150 RepID=UPI00300B5C16